MHCLHRQRYVLSNQEWHSFAETVALAAFGDSLKFAKALGKKA